MFFDDENTMPAGTDGGSMEDTASEGTEETTEGTEGTEGEQM
jgi:hypothetical protein